MKVLVTGATGFIGNHVISDLLLNGVSVIATSTAIEKAKEFDWFSKVEYIPYSINGNYEGVNLYEYFGKPDKLIHLAWNGLPNYTKSFHYEENLWNDYYFLKNLIENGLKDLTITGTCFEYGLTEGCLNEEMNTNPSNSYSLAKDTLRKFIVELNKERSIDFKWIRLFYMHGYGQNKLSLIPQLEAAISRGEKVFNMSAGEQQRDYLHVNDVAKRIGKIALQNDVTGIINCCSGRPVKLKDFIKEYLKENNKNIELNLGYYAYSAFEPMNFWGDTAKFNSI